MTVLRWFFLIVLLAGVGLFCWGHAEARADPIVRTGRIGFRDWPAGKAPVRVLLAADIHMGNLTMEPARLMRIVEQMNALAPDIVLLDGDFVAGHAKATAVAVARDIVAPLSGLKAPLGVFGVLGNHDESTLPRLLGRALTRAGVRVLHDQAAQAGPLVLVGLADGSSFGPHIDKAIASARGMRGVKVVMTHANFRHYLEGRIQLMLVGHTHCEQIALSRYGIRNPYFVFPYPCGMVRDRFGVTVTTAGLGTSIVPLRYNAPPDMWLLTLGPVGRSGAEPSGPDKS